MAPRDSAFQDQFIALQDHVVRLAESAGRIEGKLDTFIAQMAVQDERTSKHDERIGKVENRQHWYAGVAAGLGALLGKFAPGLLGHS